MRHIEDDWHSLIKGREENIYPKDGQEVIVKLYNQEKDEYFETTAIFNDKEHYRSWVIHKDNVKSNNLPAWWKYAR